MNGIEIGKYCLLTADKMEIKNFPKLPSATSFIRKPLYEIMEEGLESARGHA